MTLKERAAALWTALSDEYGDRNEAYPGVSMIECALTYAFEAGKRAGIEEAAKVAEHFGRRVAKTTPGDDWAQAQFAVVAIEIRALAKPEPA